MLAPTKRQRGHELGVDVALDNLRGNGRRTETQLFADISLDARREMRAGADRAGKFADGGGFADAFEAFQRAAKFVVHQGQLEAERGRFGMDAVAAANAGREFVFARLRRDGFPQAPCTSAMKMSALCVICTANAVSMMSLLVRPK